MAGLVLSYRHECLVALYRIWERAIDLDVMTLFRYREPRFKPFGLPCPWSFSHVRHSGIDLPKKKGRGLNYFTEKSVHI
jgi:hypothetical protein